MRPAPLLTLLIAHPAMRGFLTGAGFFSDAYDLFVTDGVTNILKNLGPTQRVLYSYTDVNGTGRVLASYFNVLCHDRSTRCMPFLYSNSSGGSWTPNPDTYYSEEMQPRYQAQTPDLKNGVSNAALIGSVLGQLFFGVAGDMFGRKWNFFITSALIILGCLGSATAAAGHAVPGNLNAAGAWGDTSPLPASSASDVYLQLYCWRAILGFAIGGEYPLASSVSSEGASGSRGQAVLLTFSMQGWGKLTASLMNYALVSSLRYYGGPWALDATWRFALAFGCTMNILTIYFRYHMHESAIYSAVKKQETGVDAHVVVIPAEAGAVLPVKVAAIDFRTTLRILWEFKWVLVGTASTWFLIDVTFYGQSLMNTSVVYQAVAGTNTVTNAIDKLRASLLATVYIMIIALPGYWVAIALIDRMGRWYMQMSGFFFSAVCFSVLAGAYFTPLRSSGNGAGFVFVYGATYFFANFGPNAVTFLMPAEAFPTPARSTAHGFSAAMGKLGATTGSFGLLAMWNAYCKSQLDSTGQPNCTFSSTPTPAQVAESDAGVVGVMAVCVAVSILGMIMTALFCPETGSKTLHQVDAQSRVLAESARRHAQGKAGQGGGEIALQRVGNPLNMTAAQEPVVEDWEPVSPPQRVPDKDTVSLIQSV